MFEKLPKNREFFYHSFLKNKSFGQQIGFTFAVSKQMEKAVQYETVIGLEVHARLNTKSKLFSGDAVAFGAEPNTNISPIVLAHPGTLPKMNKKAIEYAVKMGLACHCEIAKENWFARKNYFYPDLPKGYQVKRGEVIGWVGSTGKSTGPHCHYEVHKYGEKIDPIYFFYNDLSPDQFDQILKKAAASNQSLD